MRVTRAVVAVMLTQVSWAVAAPPPGADMTLAPWFESLRQPGTGFACCSVSDCRGTEYRIVDGHYEAQLPSGAWIAVPDATVLHRHDNPTGRAVLCYLPYRGVICFVPGSGT